MAHHRTRTVLTSAVLGLLCAGVAAPAAAASQAAPSSSAQLAEAASHDCGGVAATLVGTPGDDVLRGGNGPDVIAGLGGNDTITGGNGADLLCGGDGNDTLTGGNGDDKISGGPGADTISGDNGDDNLNGAGGETTDPQPDANDTITGGNGSDLLAGSTGADQLRGGNANDTHLGGDGNDTCAGGNGDDAAPACETTTATEAIAPAIATPQYTRGFDVYNFTSQPLTYKSVSFPTQHPEGLVGSPTIGSVLNIGQNHHFELTFIFTAQVEVKADYGNASTLADYTGEMIVDSFTGLTAQICTPSQLCNPSNADGSEYPSTTIRFLDPAGTASIVPASDPGAQKASLTYCLQSSDYTCTYAVKTQSVVVTGIDETPRQVSNFSGNPERFSFAYEIQVLVTNALGVATPPTSALSAAVAAGTKAVNANCVYAASYTYSGTGQVTLPPRTAGVITGVTPTCVYTGDMTVKAWNTTWTLQDVEFSSPDPGGDAAYVFRATGPA